MFEGNLRDLVYFWHEMKLENQQDLDLVCHILPIRKQFFF